MLRFPAFWALFLMALSPLYSQSTWQPFQTEERYQVRQDLRALEGELLPVELIPPLLNDTVVEFRMARIIPGTYSVANYGQFVRHFAALNARGDTLPSERLDLNRWRISRARELYKIVYRVADTYRQSDHTVFPPAGSSHRDSVFLLNNFAYIGYLEGYQDRPYQLEIAKPSGFYGATALSGQRSDSLDRFPIANFFELHDNPLLYCRPDTASLRLGGTVVEVSVYSPGKLVNAQRSLEVIRPVIEGAKDFFGGELPVDRYAVLIYTVPLSQVGNSYGALEHRRSTVLYLPEMGSDYFYDAVRDVTAHEFFHILTPLGLHSEQVHFFDFNQPEMSQHLWLYEGVTEYNSHLVQLRSELYDWEEFFAVLRDKLESAADFDRDIPLTLASRYTLEPFKEEYLNFYQKGALAGLALDLQLLKLSEGEMNLIDLLRKLRADFPSDTFFYDEQLFRLMEEASYPGIEEFMLRHVAGTAPFPLAELLAQVGIEYRPEGLTEGFSIGADDFSYSFESERIRVASAEGIDAFGESLGLREGDELLALNGQELALHNINTLIDDFYESAAVGQRFKLKIARPRKNGKYRTKTLKAKVEKVSYQEQHQFEWMAEPSELQLQRRAQWLGR